MKAKKPGGSNEERGAACAVVKSSSVAALSSREPFQTTITIRVSPEAPLPLVSCKTHKDKAFHDVEMGLRKTIMEMRGKRGSY